MPLSVKWVKSYLPSQVELLFHRLYVCYINAATHKHSFENVCVRLELAGLCTRGPLHFFHRAYLLLLYATAHIRVSAANNELLMRLADELRKTTVCDPIRTTTDCASVYHCAI
jgi:hypothetical protein